MGNTLLHSFVRNEVRRLIPLSYLSVQYKTTTSLAQQKDWKRLAKLCPKVSKFAYQNLKISTHYTLFVLSVKKQTNCSFKRGFSAGLFSRLGAVAGGFCYFWAEPVNLFPLVPSVCAGLSYNQLLAIAPCLLYRHESGISLLISLLARKGISRFSKMSAHRDFQ